MSLNGKYIHQKHHIKILVWLLLAFGMAMKGQELHFEPAKFYFPPDNNRIASEGFLRDGKPDGYWKTYYENGILKSEGNRKDFQLDSTWKFYNDKGVLVLSYTYKKGKKNGPRFNYDPTKKYLVSEENYVDDVKHGLTKYYYPNGQVKEIKPYVKGREEGNGYAYDNQQNIVTLTEYKMGFTRHTEHINKRDTSGLKQDLWKEFYPNPTSNLADGPGPLKTECTYIDDKKHGYLKEYSPKGDLLSMSKYAYGKLVPNPPELAHLDTKTTYYEGGIIRTTGTYKKGIPEGAFREFSPEGKITAAKVYKEGNLVGEGIYDEADKEQGPWKEYYPTGQLKAEGNYSNGKRVGNWVFYYPNGKVEQQGNYDGRGRAQGTWKWYYDSGNPLREENYVDDILNGETVEYDESGKLITKGQYLDGQKEEHWEYQLGGYSEVGSYKGDRRDGMWKHYYFPSGKLRFEGTFQDDNPDGKHTYYYPNGKVKETGKFIMGRKEGTWEYYDEEGNRFLTILYKDDVELKVDGVKIKEGR